MKILDTTRAAYNKTKKTNKVCYFCDASVILQQECTDFDFQYWHVLVNKHPYLDGNVMIIPKKHKTKLVQLSETEWVEFSHVIVSVQATLAKVFNCESFNIALNEGKNSGRSVPHLHWQIIPRRKKNRTAIDIFAEIDVVTTAPADLKELLSKKKRAN